MWILMTAVLCGFHSTNTERQGHRIELPKNPVKGISDVLIS